MLKLRKVFSYMVVAFLVAASFVGCDNLTNKTEATKYTVTYSTEKGTAPNSIEVEENTVLTAEQLPELTADGYTFGGWYDGETQAVAGTYAVTKDVTLVAKWSVLPVEVEAQENLFGTYTGTMTVTYNGNTSENSVVIKLSDGSLNQGGNYGAYTKIKWFKDGENFIVAAQSDTTNNKNGELTAENYKTASSCYITFGEKITYIVPAMAGMGGTVILSKAYTVSYSTEQGTAPNQIEVEENTVLTAEQLPELTADGYTFGGWYDGETQAVAGTYAVTKDVTLVAKWENILETKKNSLFGKSFLASLTDSSDNKTYDAVIDIESSGTTENVKLTTAKYYMICDTTDWSLSGNNVVLKAWEATSMSVASGRSADSPNVTLTFSSNLSNENPNKVEISYANIVTYAYDGQTEEEEKASLESTTSASTTYTVSRNQSVSLSGSFSESPAMLDCFVDAMGGQQFGHAVFKGISFKNNNGNIEANLKLGSGVGVIYGIAFIAYVEPSIKSVSDDTYSTPKYYDANGNLQDATYTVSTTDFGIRNVLPLTSKKVEKVYVTDSMTIPVSKDKSEYNLWIYINSNVMGVQFCDGTGSGSSQQPNVSTKFVGKLVIDWDKVTVE